MIEKSFTPCSQSPIIDTMFAAVSAIIFPALTFLTPLIFWTLTPNYFNTPKQILLILSVSLLTLAHLWDLVTTRTFNYSASRLRVPLLLFFLALAASLFANSIGRTEALVGRGSLYFVAIILGYYASMAPRTTIKYALYGLLASSSILAVQSLLTLTLFPQLSNLPTFLTSKSFTPTGSPLTTVTLFIITFFPALISSVRASSLWSKIIYIVVASLMLIAAVAYLALMLGGRELTPTLLPLLSSWSIALDAMKSIRSIIFGVGLENFGLHYTRVKPLLINSTALWNAIPSSSSSELLHLATTAGILGASTFLLLLIRAATQTKILVLPLCALVLIFTPASISVISLLFIFLGLTYSEPVSHFTFSKPLHSLSLATFKLLVLGYLLFLVSFPVRAELALGQANNALAAGNGRGAYENTLRAVELMPNMASYRLAYSSINLRLASALSQKESLTDQERSSVTQLVSQAIRESRSAVSLQSTNAYAWSNLGSVYRNLINVAEGADQFAVNSYAQAVSLDPGNPALRVEFGGLLYQLSEISKDDKQKGNYLSRAIEQFSLAVELKRDFPNAYYNLSKALELQGDIVNAHVAMRQVVTYLDPGSPDYPTAVREVERLQTLLPSTPTPTPTESDQGLSAGRDLVEPSPLPSPLPGGPLDLPPAN